MTATVDVTLQCDHEGCPRTVRTVLPNTVKGARDLAKGEGWAVRTTRVIDGHPYGPLDYCPIHRDPERGRKN